MESVWRTVRYFAFVLGTYLLSAAVYTSVAVVEVSAQLLPLSLPVALVIILYLAYGFRYGCSGVVAMCLGVLALLVIGVELRVGLLEMTLRTILATALWGVGLLAGGSVLLAYHGIKAFQEG